MGSSAHSGYAFSPAATAPPPGVYVESGNARPEPVGSGDAALDSEHGGFGTGGDGQLGQDGADVLGGGTGAKRAFSPGCAHRPVWDAGDWQRNALGEEIAGRASGPVTPVFPRRDVTRCGGSGLGPRPRERGSSW